MLSTLRFDGTELSLCACHQFCWWWFAVLLAFTFWRSIRITIMFFVVRPHDSPPNFTIIIIHSNIWLSIGTNEKFCIFVSLELWTNDDEHFLLLKSFKPTKAYWTWSFIVHELFGTIIRRNWKTIIDKCFSIIVVSSSNFIPFVITKIKKIFRNFMLYSLASDICRTNFILTWIRLKIQQLYYVR